MSANLARLLVIMSLFQQILLIKQLILDKISAKLIKFNQIQIAGLAEVARDIAQILFAALVVEGLNKEKINLLIIFIGLIGSIIFWYTNHLINSILKS